MYTFNKYFCGNLISEYGRKHGKVDYSTFCKAFDAVLNNGIMQELENQGYYFDIESGLTDNSEEIEELNSTISDIEDSDDFTEDEKAERIEELREKIEELESDQNDMEIFQYYIVSDSGAELIRDYNVGILFYNSDLDLYIWGIQHYGTSWDYVLTNIPCDVDPDARV